MPATTGFKLQPTDLQIILIAYELHVVTVELFATLTGRSPIALWRRLRKLCKEHYLRIVAEYDDRYVFSLGSAGVDALVEARLAPPELKEKRRREHELRLRVHRLMRTA